MGQKVYPNQRPGPGDRPTAPNMGPAFGGMGGNPQALLAQQNSNLEALERRSQRDRSGSMNTVRLRSLCSWGYSHPISSVKLLKHALRTMILEVGLGCVL